MLTCKSINSMSEMDDNEKEVLNVASGKKERYALQFFSERNVFHIVDTEKIEIIAVVSDVAIGNVIVFLLNSGKLMMAELEQLQAQVRLEQLRRQSGTFTERVYGVNIAPKPSIKTVG